ncbi:MAG: dienelactone hydrolase family protein [Pelagibacterales bacterium]|nr:dienelactone hydrolase family protein [Pelagibacterales bacterium]
MTTIDGPSIHPLSGSQAKQLVIFCHGYGADGNDLIGLANYFQQILPDAYFISPNAPESCPMNPMGYQWFDFTSNDSDLIWKKVNDAGEILNNFIDNKLNELNLSDKDLSLVGFSQGTMMSLHVGLRRSVAMSSIVGFSGRLIREDTLSDDMKSKPPIYLIHGDQDPMVPYSDTINAAKILKDLDVDVQSHISPNTPHSIAQDGLEIAIKFLSSNFSQNK